MLTTTNSLAATAIAAAGLGVGLLYGGWRRKAAGVPVLSLAWLLVALSIAFWTRASGPELGPVIALMLLPMIAWCFVASNRHVRRNPGRLQEPAAVILPGFRAATRHAAIFLASVPLAASAGTLMTLAVSSWLPWNETDRLAFALLIAPVAWGLFAFWATSDPRLSRPVLGLLAGGSLGAAWLFT